MSAPQFITIDDVEYELVPVEGDGFEKIRELSPDGAVVMVEPATAPGYRKTCCAFVCATKGGGWLTPEQSRKVAAYLEYLADCFDEGVEP